MTRKKNLETHPLAVAGRKNLEELVAQRASASFRQAEDAMARAFPPTKVWLNITDADGVLLERIALDDYNLAKPLGRSALLEEIRAAAERARSR